VQCVDDRPGALLPRRAPAVGIAGGALALDVVELGEELQRLLTDRAAVVGPEFMELAPGVRYAAERKCESNAGKRCCTTCLKRWASARREALALSGGDSSDFGLNTLPL